MASRATGLTTSTIRLLGGGVEGIAGERQVQRL